MRSALSGSRSPSSALTRAAAALIRPSQRATGTGIGSPATGKFSIAFRVSEPQSSRAVSVSLTRSMLLRVGHVRARELGSGSAAAGPGRHGALTDVPGVRVGHATLVEGASVRTGVTVIVPADEPVFAGHHRLNGNGELTGTHWIRESGLLTTPMGLTNTFDVGTVQDALAPEPLLVDASALRVSPRT